MGRLDVGSRIPFVGELPLCREELRMFLRHTRSP